MRSLTYIEIDLPRCANTYGSSPCTASVGVTGDFKCFNTPNTCQDRVNFVSDDDPTTMRFAKDVPFLPRNIDCIPSILSVNFTPGQMNPGVSLGTRSSLTVTFRDHPHSDTLPNMLDPYLADRAYNPVAQGTFWAKFRARHFFVKGRPLRWIRGNPDQALGDMETRHFVMESLSGPDASGVFTLVAKDILKLADDDRSKCPRITDGALLGGIDDNDVSLTLKPTGIGNLQYPSIGRANIGGNEVVVFARTGDAMSLVRGENGTTPRSHSADERVQLCHEVPGVDPALVIQELLEDFAGIDPSFIPIADWTAETAAYLQRVVTTVLAEPTGVKTLINELIEQMGLALWWDDVGQKIRLQVLRQIPSNAGTFDESRVMKGTYRIADQPNKRISSCHTYFGRRDVTRPVDEKSNYSSSLLTPALQNETDYGSSAIKNIFSRWIPEFGTSIASRINAIIIGRYQVPPRLIDFCVFREDTGEDLIKLGGGYQFGHKYLQDAQGARVMVPAQVISLDPQADRLVAKAEEILFVNFAPEDLTNRTITIDTNSNNLNIRTIHDSLYPEIEDEEAENITLNIIVNSSVLIGSNSTALRAFDIGDWPDDLTINLIVNGRLQGAGGNGAGAENGEELIPATAGGPALYTRFPINLTINTGGKIAGGGGGGGLGFGYGGGGAGHLPGQGTGVQPGSPGTLDAGGAPFFAGGAGGNPGQPGGGGSPGAAGASIDGDSFVTIVLNNGSILGPQVN